MSTVCSQSGGGKRRESDGKVHKIEVKVRGNGLKSRTRKTYVAPAKGTSPQ